MSRVLRRVVAGAPKPQGGAPGAAGVTGSAAGGNKPGLAAPRPAGQQLSLAQSIREAAARAKAQQEAAAAAAGGAMGAMGAAQLPAPRAVSGGHGVKLPPLAARGALPAPLPRKLPLPVTASNGVAAQPATPAVLPQARTLPPPPPQQLAPGGWGAPAPPAPPGVQLPPPPPLRHSPLQPAPLPPSPLAGASGPFSAAPASLLGTGIGGKAAAEQEWLGMGASIVKLLNIQQQPVQSGGQPGLLPGMLLPGSPAAALPRSPPRTTDAPAGRAYRRGGSGLIGEVRRI